MSKIVLGSVQWGLNYGVSNINGQTSEYEISKIAELARSNKVNLIDTSQIYGNAESLIGNYFDSTFSVITKVSIENHYHDLLPNENVLLKSVELSKSKLKNCKLNTVLVHDTSYLLSHIEKKVIIDHLLELSESGLVDRVGFSIYTLSELESLQRLMVPGALQFPANILDQRFLQDNILLNIKNKGTTLYARSVFLQGLLLLDPQKTPIYFKPWFNCLKSWHEYCQDNQVKPLHAALLYIYNNPLIDYCVVGIENSDQ